MEKNNYLVDTQTIIYASKERDGQIALWLKQNKPYATDTSYHESLVKWPEINNPDREAEKKYLERFFAEAKREGRYIETEQDKTILQRAHTLYKEHNIKPDDALIASTAEKNDYILVTADNKKDFSPRLEKLNQQGDGNFKVKAYEYENRNQTFKQWNQEYKKSITAELAMKRHLQKSQSLKNQKTNYRKR